MTIMTESPLRNLRKRQRQLEDGQMGAGARAHFADETILVDTSSLLSLAISGKLCPHLLDVLEDHVAVSVECFYAGEQLAVVATRYDDLVVIAHSGLKNGQGTSSEFVLFDASNLVLAVQDVSGRCDDREGGEFT